MHAIKYMKITAFRLEIITTGEYWMGFLFFSPDRISCSICFYPVLDGFLIFSPDRMVCVCVCVCVM
jgi:hypothetical protein